MPSEQTSKKTTDNRRRNFSKKGGAGRGGRASLGWGAEASQGIGRDGGLEKPHDMLRKSPDTLANLDDNLANHICASDDEVDAMNREMYKLVQGAIRKHPEQLEYPIHMLSASRHLERVADLATDVAEDAIYMKKAR